MATYSRIFAGKSHGQRSLVGYSTWDYQRVGHNLATKQQQLDWMTIKLVVLLDPDLPSTSKQTELQANSSSNSPPKVKRSQVGDLPVSHLHQLTVFLLILALNYKCVLNCFVLIKYLVMGNSSLNVATGIFHRYFKFGSRPLQESEYHNKACCIFFVCFLTYKNYVYTRLLSIRYTIA